MPPSDCLLRSATRLFDPNRALCRFVWNWPLATANSRGQSAIPSSGVAGVPVEDAVKGGRSPAKRTLEGVRNADMRKGLGLVAAFRGQRPSPSGGKDFTALEGGARGGGRRALQRHPPHRGGSTRNDLIRNI